MDTLALFSARADRFAGVLAGAGGRWDAPTPCTEWTAGQVVDHVIDTERDFCDRQGLPLPAPAGDDPAARFADHRRAVERRLAEPGVLDREFSGYFGPTTIGATLAEFYGWDLLVHAWDVARGTGQAWELSDAEVEQLGEGSEGWGDSLYAEGVCARPVAVPDDATAEQRLLARLGRDPHWTAPAVRTR